jgi:hypothetical protein
MDRVVVVTSFAQDRSERDAVAYWRSRPSQERIAEVERLRREYLSSIRGAAHGSPEGLSRTVAVLERTER